MLDIRNADALDKRPKMREVINGFKKGHITRFPVVALVAHDGERILFYDSRFGDPQEKGVDGKEIGVLDWEYSERGGKHGFKVKSRLIQNAKYKPYHRGHRELMTVDVKKAVSFLQQFVKPFSDAEVAVFTLDTAQTKYREWVEEAEEVFGALANEVSTKSVMQEIVALSAIGVQFTTPVFKKLAEEGIEAQAEMRRRKARIFNQSMLFLNPDDTVTLVPVAKLHDKNSSGAATLFPSINALPELVQQNLGILRMVDKNTAVPEVGMRVDDRQFWIDVPVGS